MRWFFGSGGSGSYGHDAGPVQRRSVAMALGLVVLAMMSPIVVRAALAQTKPVKIVALGDSLMAGYQLRASDAFPAQLERAMRGTGVAVEIANAGVSGDTSTGGLARIDWSVPDGTQAVILGLGANDMLRGVDPKVTRQALDSAISKLKARGIEVLLCGMLAAPNLGPDYARAYNALFPDLAKKHDVVFYPFFLDGVAGEARFNLKDGVHPSAAGVGQIVTRITPKVSELVSRVSAKQGP